MKRSGRGFVVRREDVESSFLRVEVRIVVMIVVKCFLHRFD